ncbi:MAG: hypothetical protein AAFO96_19035 [Bacteroidota bacterium]
MNLNPSDVKRLYGQTFYLVAAPPPEVPEPQEKLPEPTPAPKESEPTSPKSQTAPKPAYPFLEAGAWANWKMKPQAQLSIILQENEFKNRSLTSLLKEIIVQSGIDTQIVGFGVIPDSVPEVILTDMPTSFGIICYTFTSKLPKEVLLKGKTFFPAAPLEMLANDTRYRRAMEKLLVRFRDNHMTQ